MTHSTLVAFCSFVLSILVFALMLIHVDRLENEITSLELRLAEKGDC